MAAPNVPWIAINSGSPGQGDGTLEFTVARNNTVAERKGTVTIAGRDVTFTQPPGPPAADLNVTSLTAPVTAVSGGTLTVAAEVRNAGNLPATAFRLGFFFGAKSAVTAADTFTGFACDYNGLAAGETSVCRGALRVPVSLAPGTYYLAAIADFENRALLASRDATTRVADTGSIVITVSPSAPAFTLGGVVHGANGLAATTASVVSPGQVVVLYGERLGPAELTPSVLENGRFPTQIAGTSVLVNNLPVPLLYASATQVAALLPLRISGATARLQVVAGALSSEALTLNVVTAAPGFFTTNFSGTGPVAALNEDFSVNTAANPASRGGIIQLYGTGFGALNPLPLDGSLIAAPLPALREEVKLEIDGQPAQLLYAGPAPGLAAGIVQINAIIPSGVASGAVSVRAILPGDNLSRAGTTIFVR